MDKAYETLYDALNALVYRADFAQLDQAIAEAQEIDLDEYLDLEGTKEAFTAALERALAVQANVDADQETVDQAAQALIEAMAALRKTPSKEALAELVGTASAMDTSNIRRPAYPLSTVPWTAHRQSWRMKPLRKRM